MYTKLRFRPGLDRVFSVISNELRNLFSSGSINRSLVAEAPRNDSNDDLLTHN
jgi:hypothetical protein